ncbi:hypothetical protein [Halarchaeum salinum]|uniref:HNH endonuclease n=1 Tax=Halarchaeum salinum TaxID=489912 RepID=A0AAV3SA27_9EURY
MSDAESPSATGYVVDEVTGRRRRTASWETKPTCHGYTGGGYERWRSVEWRPESSRRAREDVYVAHHRLLAVVACYDADQPLGEVLDDLRGKDVHHRSGVEWDNRPGNLEVLDHGRHASVTQAQMRAWASDAKEAVESEEDATPRSEVCASCGGEDPCARVEGVSGLLCLECATSSGSRIEIVA